MWITKINKFIFLLSLIGCLVQRTSEIDRFEHIVFSKLLAVDHFQIFGQQSELGELILKGPQSTRIPVAQFQSSFSRKNYCLFFQYQKKGEAAEGEFYFFESTEKCLKLNPFEKKLELAMTGKLKEVRAFYSDKKQLFFQSKRLPRYNFNIFFKSEGQKKVLSFPMPNIYQSDQKIITKRHQTIKENRLMSGVTFLPFKYQKKVDFLWPKVKGQKFLKNDYIQGEFTWCKRYNRKCQLTEKSSCYRCPNGFMPVVSLNCPEKLAAICGPIICGKKGWPACVKGVETVKKVGCFHDSDQGICEAGTRTFCDENGILICI